MSVDYLALKEYLDPRFEPVFRIIAGYIPRSGTSRMKNKTDFTHSSQDKKDAVIDTKI